MPNRYKNNVLIEIDKLLRPVAPLARALDVGAGDGYYAARLMERGLVREVTPVEVQARPNSELTPVLYDGRTLPFEDGAFELSYAVDVIHHSREPERTLRELARCTSRYLLLKDHTYDRRLGYLFLCALDEVGNRRFGIPSRYHYQHGWEWSPILEGCGLRLVRKIYPARCERGLLGLAVNPFQFVSLWQRG